MDYGTVTKLECPICVKTMRHPIYICRTGHTLCGNCAVQSTNFPACQIFLNLKKPSMYLQELSEEFEEYCRFASFGCKAVYCPSKTQEHEKLCEYRKFTCGVAGCKFNDCRKELLNHVKTKHRDYLNLNTASVRILPHLAKPGQERKPWFEPLYLLDRQDELFRVCFDEKSLHVHAFNFGQERKFVSQFYYQNDEEKSRNIVVTEFCKGFDETCEGRRNINFSDQAKILASNNGKACVEVLIEHEMILKPLFGANENNFET